MSKRKAPIVGTTEDDGRLMDAAENTPPHDDGVLFDLDADAFDAAAPPVVFAAKTARGDIRDFILDRLKHDHQPLPWNMRGESAQKELVEQTDRAVERVISRLVEAIAADGKPVLRGTLVKVLVKDGLKAQIDMLMSDPLRHTLIDHQGRTVFVAIASTDDLMGERAPVNVKPDQSSLLDDEPKD